MKTVTILIGNTDDKLPQARWSQFLGETDDAVNFLADRVEFAGFSHPVRPWQNACWVAVVDEGYINGLRGRLAELVRRYDQESIAIVIADATQFVQYETPKDFAVALDKEFKLVTVGHDFELAGYLYTATRV